MLIITFGTACLQAQDWETILQLDSPLAGARHSSRAILVDPACSEHPFFVVDHRRIIGRVL